MERKSYRFEIDPAGKRMPTDFSWQFGFGADHAHQMLRTDMFEHLKLVHDELGAKYVRFHGVFNDDMYCYSTFRDFAPMPGNQHRVREMNFRQAGIAYDNVLKAGLKPFVELSMMPNHLAKGKGRGLHYPNNINPPKDYALYGEFIEAFIRFLLHRYGEEEVKTWYFEVWNEPDLGIFFHGKQKDYFHIYEVVSKTIKKVSPSLRVGGPSTSGCRWITPFVEFCTESGSPLDFVSTHHYPGDGFGNFIGLADYPGIFKTMRKSIKEGARLDEAMARMFFHPEKAARVPKGALVDLDEKLLSESKGLPTIVSEWNSMAIFSAPIHDEKYSAAFVLKSVLDLDNKFTGYMFWCVSDIFEEMLQVNRPFHGGFGLVSDDGIPKPNFWAFKMLSKLYPERLLSVGYRSVEPVECAAFTNGKDYQVLVVAQDNDPRRNEEFEVDFAVPFKAKNVILERIDDDHANPKGVWKSLGGMNNPLPSEVEEIKEKSALKKEKWEFAYDGSKTVVRLKLRTNDAYLFTLLED